MAEAIIYLFDAPSKQHKNGTYPVVLKVTHERKRKYFKTGRTCLPEQWNEATNRFNRKYSDYKRENEVLLKIETKAKDIIYRFEREDTPFSFSEFEALYTRREDRAALVTYFEIWIEKFRKEGKNGTATAYKQSLDAIKKFKPDAGKMRLRDVTVKFLQDFEHWLRAEKQLKDTSISAYMRSLRALMNRAIKEGVLKRENYPFYQYKIAELNVETAKRAIPKEALKSIEALSFPENSTLRFAKDVFLFSYYCRGINFADIAYLTPDNIEGNTLKYVRRKTGKPFSIGLLPPAKQIIDYYKETNQNVGNYIFPVFDDTIHRTEKQKFDRRRTVLRDINKALKTIAEMIGMPGLKLSSYVARHTYATVLKMAGTNTAHISEALGHQSEKVTQTYLKSFGDDTLNEIDKNVL